MYGYEHHPFRFQEKDGVYMAMTITTNPSLPKGGRDIWPLSQPFPFPEKEGDTTTTPLPPKRKVWYMAMTITTNPLCQKGNKILGHDLAMITTIPSANNHDHQHHPPPFVKREQVAWPWSQPAPFPEEEGLCMRMITNPSLSEERNECTWS